MRPSVRRMLLLVVILTFMMSVCVGLEAAAKKTKVQVISWWDFTTSQTLIQL